MSRKVTEQCEERQMRLGRIGLYPLTCSQSLASHRADITLPGDAGLCNDWLMYRRWQSQKQGISIRQLPVKPTQLAQVSQDAHQHLQEHGLFFVNRDQAIQATAISTLGFNDIQRFQFLDDAAGGHL